MYLEEGLSIQKMYRLYTEYYSNGKNIEKLASSRQYRDIFNTEFNISFFKPKKDQRDVCSVFNLADETEKATLRENYERHIANKLLASIEYDIGKNEGYCYVWHEQIAKRGSNEIASCLWKFLENQKNKGIKTVILYSDNCGGQNRNHIIFSMFAYAAVQFQLVITHRFLEKGHTRNEGDSMHAVIENAKKRQSVLYVPEQWITLIRMAKTTGKVYDVTEMSQDDFLDFKSLANTENWKTDIEKGMIKLSRVKEISTSYNTPSTTFFKYDLSSESQRCDLKKARRGRPPIIDKLLLKCFLPIAKKKLTGLLWLCDTSKIPPMYHGFYRNLNTDTTENDEDNVSSEEEEEL
nr:unnamed protein product [Callosobruchus chinensis]